MRFARSHFHVPGAHWSAEEAERRLAELRHLPGVCSLTLNRTCGTLHISYDIARLSARELREHYVRSEKAARAQERGAGPGLTGMRWAPLLIELVSTLFATLRT